MIHKFFCFCFSFPQNETGPASRLLSSHEWTAIESAGANNAMTAGVQKRKALEKGIEQLVQEGVVQIFSDPEGGSASWILGAMGPLQFDVMRHRLKTEYGVDLTLSVLPYTMARWPQEGFDPEDFRYSERIRVVRDRDDNWALLAQSPWDFDRVLERNEDLVLAETPDPSLFESAV